MPLSPLLMAGFSNSANAGPIGRTSGRCALDFGALSARLDSGRLESPPLELEAPAVGAWDCGDLPGWFGVSGCFAMARNMGPKRLP